MKVKIKTKDHTQVSPAVTVRHPSHSDLKQFVEEWLGGNQDFIQHLFKPIEFTFVPVNMNWDSPPSSLPDLPTGYDIYTHQIGDQVNTKTFLQTQTVGVAHPSINTGGVIAPLTTGVVSLGNLTVC